MCEPYFPCPFLDSDYVRLDANMIEEGAVGGVSAAEAFPLMNASSSSMTTSSSSVSSNFRFVHPFALPPQPQLPLQGPPADLDGKDVRFIFD